jgi:hypothetical protein
VSVVALLATCTNSMTSLACKCSRCMRHHCIASAHLDGQSSLQMSKSDPELSTWTLCAKLMSRKWTLAWLARNRAPIRCASLVQSATTQHACLNETCCAWDIIAAQVCERWVSALLRGTAPACTGSCGTARLRRCILLCVWDIIAAQVYPLCFPAFLSQGAQPACGLRDDQLCRNQKIHWSSVDGSMKGTGGVELRNRGEIRFVKRGEDACHVTITFEFEVPGPLMPVASALKPFGNSILTDGMQQFANFAQQEYSANGDALPAAPSNVSVTS